VNIAIAVKGRNFTLFLSIGRLAQKVQQQFLIQYEHMHRQRILDELQHRSLRVLLVQWKLTCGKSHLHYAISEILWGLVQHHPLIMKFKAGGKCPLMHD